MNLAQTRIGQIVTVAHIAGEGSFRRRLMELGLVPGTRIEVIGVAPLGDPLELLVRGSSLSIRRAEAEGVSVSLGEGTSAERAPGNAGRSESNSAPRCAWPRSQRAVTQQELTSVSEREPAAGQGATRTPLLLLMGNPNTGKTTLFNRLTGQNARIGNYPGITVERRSGDLTLRADGAPRVVEVVDVPGAYSLSARSAEEQIALSAVLGWAENPRPDLCVVVVDAGQLARNLYLVTQLLEFDVQIVVALNMIDEVRDNPPNAEELSRFLGVPCVATDARHGTGLEQLERALSAALSLPPRTARRIDYPNALERDLERVSAALPSAWRENTARARALALWALTSIETDDELQGVDPALRARCLALRATAGARDIDQEVIATRYALIDAELPKLYPRLEAHPKKRKTSERVDRVLLHPVFGFAIFIGLMLLMFQSLFSWSDPAIRLIEYCTSKARISSRRTCRNRSCGIW